MSTRPRDRETSRAEARRRARLAARGELSEVDADVTEPGDEPTRRGFLGRLFPPAPPLPNKPSPLAGFDESGPLLPIRVRIFLLRRNPLAWLATGLVAAVGYFASIVFGPEDILSLLGTMLRFFALIAAGWMGWQRPALYGTAAAVVGFVLFAAVLLVAPTSLGGAFEAMRDAGIVTRLLLEGAFQAALGFLGGWYGGYLRRRQADLSAGRARVSRRR